MSKKLRKPVGRVVRHTLADGSVKEYKYGSYKPKALKRDPSSLMALITAWESSPEYGRLAKSTKTNYTIYTGPLGKIGHVAASKITRAELIAIRNAIAGARGPGAATGFVRAASALFGWAVDQGRLDRTPMHRVKAMPGGHLTAWTPAQASDATKGLPDHLRRAVVLALHTGQRRGDLISLRWSAYDGLTVRLTQQKTGAALVIPVSPALKLELDAWKKAAVSTHILTDQNGVPWVPLHLSEQLPRHLVKIGLPALGIHGLRKLAASQLAQAGCSMHEIAAITGHRTLSMVQLYTASADQETMARAAIAKLQTTHKSKKVKV